MLFEAILISTFVQVGSPKAAVDFFRDPRILECERRVQDLGNTSADRVRRMKLGEIQESFIRLSRDLDLLPFALERLRLSHRLLRVSAAVSRASSANDEKKREVWISKARDRLQRAMELDEQFLKASARTSTFGSKSVWNLSPLLFLTINRLHPARMPSAGTDWRDFPEKASEARAVFSSLSAEQKIAIKKYLKSNTSVVTLANLDAALDTQEHFANFVALLKAQARDPFGWLKREAKKNPQLAAVLANPEQAYSEAWESSDKRILMDAWRSVVEESVQGWISSLIRSKQVQAFIPKDPQFGDYFIVHPQMQLKVWKKSDGKIKELELAFLSEPEILSAIAREPATGAGSNLGPGGQTHITLVGKQSRSKKNKRKGGILGDVDSGILQKIPEDFRIPFRRLVGRDEKSKDFLLNSIRRVIRHPLAEQTEEWPYILNRMRFYAEGEQSFISLRDDLNRRNAAVMKSKANVAAVAPQAERLEDLMQDPDFDILDLNPDMTYEFTFRTAPERGVQRMRILDSLQRKIERDSYRNKYLEALLKGPIGPDERQGVRDRDAGDEWTKSIKITRHGSWRIGMKDQNGVWVLGGWFEVEKDF